MSIRMVRIALVSLGAAAAAAFSLGVSPASAAPVKLTQAQAESQLRTAGITWSSSGHCTTRSNSTCTSFEQINQTTVTGAVTLRRAGGCTLNITGGTEVGHASGTYSHYNGYKVDFTKNSCLNSYVTSAFARISDRADGYPQWKSAAGNIYCDENSHWDVTYF